MLYTPPGGRGGRPPNPRDRGVITGKNSDNQDPEADGQACYPQDLLYI